MPISARIRITNVRKLLDNLKKRPLYTDAGLGHPCVEALLNIWEIDNTRRVAVRSDDGA